MVATGGLVALGGCSGSAESSGKVVKNELEGNLEVTEMSLKNTTVLGTKAVVAEITIENSADEKIPIGIETNFYDGDTKIGTDQSMKYVPEYEVEGCTSKRVQEGIEGRKKDVSKYEVSIFDKRNGN